MPTQEDQTLVGPGRGPSSTTGGAARSTASRVLPDLRRDGEVVRLVPRKEDRYETKRELGRGGMGEVSLAVDHDIGRDIAIKRLIGKEQAPHVLARFIDEVRTVGRMEHPNIVPVHDVGMDAEGRFFFVMKYCDGETLASIIEKLAEGDAQTHRRFGFEQRLDIFVGILNALQYAHGLGVIHRDIKPENIMVGRHGEVIVMDWGIARPMGAPEPGNKPHSEDGASGGAANPSESASSEGPNSTLPERASADTHAGAVLGTPLYMSPEQAGGATVELDERSDLYSAFAVLFELLTLRHYLGDCKGLVDTLVKVQERECPGVSDSVFLDDSHQPPVPTELRHFLHRGLQKDPAQRFETSFDALMNLGQLRSGEIEVECAVTFMKRGNHTMERFMDKHPRLSIMTAVATVTVVLGSVAGFLTLLVLRLVA